MDDVYRSLEHPTDADLLESVLAREQHPHVAGCADCARRTEVLARAIDPRRRALGEEPFDELFYRRQAARIRARIAAGEGRRSSAPFSRVVPRRLAWAALAAAAVFALAIGLHDQRSARDAGAPAPVGALTVAGAPEGFPNAQDQADDRLLHEVDDVFDEDPDDPYDVG